MGGGGWAKFKIVLLNSLFIVSHFDGLPASDSLYLTSMSKLSIQEAISLMCHDIEVMIPCCQPGRY